ncbi:MAG: hypothetical protein M3Y48_09355 [Actinomycetota bacterium]|nr:hypothetical protein [Actinomycetota bacterium]
MTQDGRSRCGVREQAFRWRTPHRDMHRHTPPAAPRRPPAPATTPQPTVPRQVITAHTGKREVDRDKCSTPTLDPRRRQKLSFGGSTSIMTLVTRPSSEADITAWETS